MGKDSKTWKAKCIDEGYGNYWNLGDIIVMEDDMVKVVTNCNGNMNIQKTEGLKGDRFVGINDLNFKIAGKWEIIADEPQPSVSDAINPNHYKSQCSLECIETMYMAFGGTVVYDFCICNAWKYMWRYQNKNGKEDLTKARWYLEMAEKVDCDRTEHWNIETVLNELEEKQNDN